MGAGEYNDKVGDNVGDDRGGGDKAITGENDRGEASNSRLRVMAVEDTEMEELKVLII